MRRHLLILLTVAILLPSCAALFVAGAGVVQHQQAMEVVARSYVQDLAENAALRLEMGWSPNGDAFSAGENLFRLRFFSWGFSMPGWIAVLDSDGKLLVASPGAEVLAVLWRQGLPLGTAVEAQSRDGEKYTLAAYPAGKTGWYVVAAVSWSKLLGPMIRFSRWPIFVGIIGFLGLLSVYGLWRWMVSPLRELGSEVSSLKWGREIPAKDDPKAVFEIRRLRQVLHQLALSAMERAELTRRYVTDLVRVQEEERLMLAREIHDGPLQDVTALIHQIRLASLEDDGNGGRCERLDVAEEGARLAVRELRGMCDELSPPWLDLGIAQALDELTQRLSRHLDVDISVEADRSLSLAPEVTLAFFRVVQEAVHNAVRHGRAKKIAVRLFSREECVTLEISDDGAGFDPPADLEKLRVSGHRGLANMSERMVLIGGELEIDSRPGKGAVIRCLVDAVSQE